jgi:hypothetical protein
MGGSSLGWDAKPCRGRDQTEAEVTGNLGMISNKDDVCSRIEDLKVMERLWMRLKKFMVA